MSSYRVLHLEVLDQVEVDEHADGSQRGFGVRQLKVAEGEVEETQRLGRWHRGYLQTHTRVRQRKGHSPRDSEVSEG